MKKIVAWFTGLLISVFALSIIGYCTDVCSVPLTTEASPVMSALVGTEYKAKNDLPWTAYFKVSKSKFCMSSDINDISVSERQEVLDAFVYALNEDSLKISVREKQAMYNAVRNGISDITSLVVPEVLESVKPDLWGASAALYPFTGVVSTILGVITIVIILLLVLSTFCDLAYLSSSGTIESLSADAFDSEHPPFVSREALNTAKDYYEGKLSQNIYLLYFKKRWVTYIILAVAILYLISGQISSLIGWVLGLASGMTS